MTSICYRISLLTLIFSGISVWLAHELPQSLPSNQLAFVSERDGNQDIYLTDIDRGLLVNMTRHPANDASPRWSADGEALGFTSYRNSVNPQGDSYIIDIELVQTGHADLSGRLQQYYADFVSNPSGNVFVPPQRRVGIEAISTQQQSIVITENEQRIGTVDGYIFLTRTFTSGYTYSPDGHFWAFTALIDNAHDVFILNLDTLVVTNISNHSREDYAPVWSPDSHFVAFTSERNGNYQVYVYELASANLTTVSPRVFREVDVVWSPDSHYLSLNLASGRNGEIYVVEVDGEHLRNISRHPAPDYQMVWRP